MTTKNEIPFAEALADGRVKLTVRREPTTNAKEAQGHETGFLGKGKPCAAVFLSVWKVENGIAFCECCNAWGAILDETRPVVHLAAYIKEVAP